MPSSGVPVVLLHAYDRRNSGDGLLVDEAIRVVTEAGVSSDNIHVVALNAGSFAGVGVNLWQHPGLGRGQRLPIGGVAVSAGTTLSALTVPSVATRYVAGGALRDARMIVGVGGGYMQARGGKRSALAMLTHGTQLALALACDARTVYLPQSVGPLRGVIGGYLRHQLGRLDTLMLRDDRSVEEVRSTHARFAPLISGWWLLLKSWSSTHGRRRPAPKYWV